MGTLWSVLDRNGEVSVWKRGEGGMVKRVFRACVEENRGRGRTQRRWMDSAV